MSILTNYCHQKDTTIKVGIVGLPNVGKTCLVNSLKKARGIDVVADDGTLSHSFSTKAGITWALYLYSEKCAQNWVQGQDKFIKKLFLTLFYAVPCSKQWWCESCVNVPLRLGGSHSTVTHCIPTLCIAPNTSIPNIKIEVDICLRRLIIKIL